MPRLLITGGSGFIGANLVRLLLERDYDVRVLDRGSSSPTHYLHGLEVERYIGDVRDREAVERAVQGCALIVHLAAQSGIVQSLHNPESDLDINVRGTFNVLEAARANDVQRFVFASSNAVLGRQPPPATEENPVQPVSPYGAAKAAGEAYCSAYYSAFGLQTVALRFANVYGPFSSHKTSVIARFLSSVVLGRPIAVDGDGLQTRDFIHVEDLCRAIAASLEKPVGGEVFQIAGGREISIREVAGEMRHLAGREIDITDAPPRIADVRRVLANVTKAKRLLDWTPAIDLPEGLATTFRWFDAEYAAGRVQR